MQNGTKPLQTIASWMPVYLIAVGVIMLDFGPCSICTTVIKSEIILSYNFLSNVTPEFPFV